MTSAIFPWRFGQFRRGSAAGAILVAMRIATWNVDGLRARMDFITHWLKSRAPDVVGLQEVKVSDEDFPHDDFRALGYHAVVHGEKGWNGVAVLSRTPAEIDLLLGAPAVAARVRRVEIDREYRKKQEVRMGARRRTTRRCSRIWIDRIQVRGCRRHKRPPAGSCLVETGPERRERAKDRLDRDGGQPDNGTVSRRRRPGLEGADHAGSNRASRAEPARQAAKAG